MEYVGSCFALSVPIWLSECACVCGGGGGGEGGEGGENKQEYLCIIM